MGEYFKPASEPRQSEQQEKLPQLEMALETISSSEHKERNEDAGYFKKEAGIFGVFDGIGGAPAGDLASRAAMMQLTRTAIEDAIRQADSPQTLKEAISIADAFLADSSIPLTEYSVRKALRVISTRMAKAIATLTETHDPAIRKTFVQYANDKYSKKLGRMLDPENLADLEIIRHVLTRVGTTVSCGKIWTNSEGKRFVTTLQLGDSSIYRLRDGALEKLTPDHSFLTTLQEAKLLPSEEEYERQTASTTNNPDYVSFKISIADIIEKVPSDNALIGIVNELKKTQTHISVDDIRHYLTRSMSNQQNEALKAPITTSEVVSGDVLIAMTDGITDNLTLGEMKNIIERYKHDPGQLSIVLAAYASKRAQEVHARAKPDDMTAVVVAIT